MREIGRRRSSGEPMPWTGHTVSGEHSGQKSSCLEERKKRKKINAHDVRSRVDGTGEGEWVEKATRNFWIGKFAVP